MFEDSLFASASRRSFQGWTAAVSLAAQALIIGLMMISPMLFTGSLPKPLWKEVLPMPAIPRAIQIQAATTSRTADDSPSSRAIRVPSVITQSATSDTTPPVSQLTQTTAAPPGLSTRAGDNGDSQFMSLFSGSATLPTVQRPSPKTWRVSAGVEQGLLIWNIKPLYPRLAVDSRIQGDVILQAVIGKEGRIESLHALSGNPLLIEAALNAVRQWRYRPYLLNGEPVEVETQITVRFNVSQ